MNEKAKEGKADPIDATHSVRDKIGFIKHAFILSFYFLLRHIDNPDTLNEKNFYWEAMRLICR